MRPLGGRIVNESGSLLVGRMVCHVFLIETEAGLVLVDAGLARRDLERPSARLGLGFALFARPARDPAQSAFEQVRALGHDPSDVQHVILTHLDLDHAAGIVDFPQAQIHVLQAEHEAAMARRGFMAGERYRPNLWAHDPRWELYAPPQGEAWQGLEAVRALRGLPPEILLVPLTGHSLGHAGIAVDSEEGWQLHAGDAYFHHGELEPRRRCPAGLRLFQWLVEAKRHDRLRNQARLRELAARGEVKITCAHDPAELVAWA
jgi:glyoxylase-like metal-dependent hydrolase (beta-lactamase superfamily II)